MGVFGYRDAQSEFKREEALYTVVVSDAIKNVFFYGFLTLLAYGLGTLNYWIGVVAAVLVIFPTVLSIVPGAIAVVLGMFVLPIMWLFERLRRSHTEHHIGLKFITSLIRGVEEAILMVYCYYLVAGIAHGF